MTQINLQHGHWYELNNGEVHRCEFLMELGSQSVYRIGGYEYFGDSIELSPLTPHIVREVATSKPRHRFKITNEMVEAAIEEYNYPKGATTVYDTVASMLQAAADVAMEGKG